MENDALLCHDIGLHEAFRRLTSMLLKLGKSAHTYEPTQAGSGWSKRGMPQGLNIVSATLIGLQLDVSPLTTSSKIVNAEKPTYCQLQQKIDSHTEAQSLSQFTRPVPPPWLADNLATVSTLKSTAVQTLHSNTASTVFVGCLCCYVVGTLCLAVHVLAYDYQI